MAVLEEVPRDAGQVSEDAARVYDEFFVPALFGPFAPQVAEATGAGPGNRALDIACGTGVLARAFRERVGPLGAVTGLDCNPGMLAVARENAPGIDWCDGCAEALCLDDSSFDAVGSQFGLMFFDNCRAALREMARVLPPGGGLAVAVWDAAERSLGYAAIIDLIDRLFGSDAADRLRAPFILGDTEALLALAESAGLDGARIEPWPGSARFASLEAWVETDVRGWTLSEVIDDAGYARLLSAARKDLAGFVRSDGTVQFESPALAIVWRKPGSG